MSFFVPYVVKAQIPKQSNHLHQVWYYKHEVDLTWLHPAHRFVLGHLLVVAVERAAGAPGMTLSILPPLPFIFS